MTNIPCTTFLGVRPNLYKEFSEPIIIFQSQYKNIKLIIIKLGLGSGSNIYLCEVRYIPQTSMYYPGHTFLDVRPNLYKEFSEPIIFFQSQYKINKINIIMLGLNNIYFCDGRFVP